MPVMYRDMWCILIPVHLSLCHIDLSSFSFSVVLGCTLPEGSLSCGVPRWVTHNGCMDTMCLSVLAGLLQLGTKFVHMQMFLLC